MHMVAAGRTVPRLVNTAVTREATTPLSTAPCNELSSRHTLHIAIILSSTVCEWYRPRLWRQGTGARGLCDLHHTLLTSASPHWDKGAARVHKPRWTTALRRATVKERLRITRPKSRRHSTASSPSVRDSVLNASMALHTTRSKRRANVNKLQ